MTPEFATLLYLAALFVAASVLAWLLKRAGAPGWAIVGGVIAGILLGPTIFGRLAPTMYESIVVGGMEQRESLQELVNQHQADRLAATEVGADAEAMQRIEDEQTAERREHEAALDDARWSHQQTLRIVTAAVVLLTLLGAGLQRRLPAGARQPFLGASTIGLWAAVLPGAIAGICMYRWWEYDLAATLLVSAAVMIGPWLLTDVDREAADRAELGGARLMQLAGRVASVTALLTILATFLVVTDPVVLVWMLPLGGLVLGWFLPVPDHRAVNAALHWVLLPMLGALCAMHVELIEHFAFWPLLILLVLSGDGRWIGAAIGAMSLGGRRVLRTMRLVMGSCACGPTQLAVLALLAMTWSLPEELLPALLFGAVLIEISVPARRSLAQRLAETEEEMREFEDEG